MCDCGISWLIDRRGTYLPKVLGGQCTNLVDNMSQLQNNTFEDLNFTNFITCFGIILYIITIIADINESSEYIFRLF